MSYRISMIIPDSKLKSTLANLGTVEIEYSPDGPSKSAETNGKSKGKFLSLGPSDPPPGSSENYKIIVREFKKLEKKHGAHQVTRALLRDKLATLDLADWVRSQGVLECIKHGYLVQT